MLNVSRIRCCGVKTGVICLIADDRIHRADHASANTGRLENAVDQVAGGRLAVRAGDPDDGHAPARVTMPGCMQPRQGASPVRDLYCWHTSIHDRLLAHYSGRTPVYRVRNISMPVNADAAVRNKESARRDLARV